MRKIEIWVGAFLMGGIASLLILALKVSSLSEFSSIKSYHIIGVFDNIGSLKLRSPITLAGVRLGEVTNIKLDQNSFKALVTMKIAAEYNHIPNDTVLCILTQGMLGASYIALQPGFSSTFLKEGDIIEHTQSSLILESLVSRLVLALQNKGASK